MKIFHQRVDFFILWRYTYKAVTNYVTQFNTSRGGAVGSSSGS